MASHWLAVALCGVLVVGCGTKAPQPSATPTTWITLAPPRSPSPTQGASATHTPISSATPTPSLTLTPSPANSPSNTPSVTPTLTSPPTFMPSATPTLNLSAAKLGAAQNLELVGHHALGAVGWWGGLALKGVCAYVGTYAAPQVSIVNIADPVRPSPLGALDLPGGAQPVEVRTLPDLNLLVVADLVQHRLLTYDITECSRPVPLGIAELPGSPHEFYLWRDGARVLAYAAMFDHAPPDLVVIDLTDPAKPVEAGRWSAQEEGVTGILHSLSVSPDGKTAYLALWHGGFVVVEVNLPHIAVKRDPAGRVTQALLPNTHSALPLRDPRYVLLASEVFQCPFEGLAVVDIMDPARPTLLSHFLLPENRCDNLPAPDAVFTPHNPLVVGDLVFASWYAAGVQVLDLSDPRAPRRVGQFVPSGEGAARTSLLGVYPAQMFSYLILREGLFYVVDSQSGLYVLRYTGPGAEALAAIPLAEGNVTIQSR